MRFPISEVEAALHPLVGLRLAQIYNAADMRGFLFGKEGFASGRGADWCLHVSCTWRLEDGAGIVTGSFDWWENATREGTPPEEWDPARGGSLQEKILRSLLQDDPGEDGTIRNRTKLLLVNDVIVDRCGGFLILFDESYRLAVFPSTTRGEMWRVFADYENSPYFVMEA